MPDALPQQYPRDANRINIHDHGEVGFWCKRIGCTRAQLVVAVHTVGPQPAAVSSFIREAAPPSKLQAMSVRNSPAPAPPAPPP